MADTLHIFHLKLDGELSLILSPFGRTARLAESEAPVLGHYGADPALDAVGDFRGALYRQADGEIRAWLSEQRFIPRFALSALVFLLLYFVFSFAVRGPLPLLLPLLGGLAGAVACFLLLSRRDALSSRAVERRAKLRSRIDAIAFSHSVLLETLEDLVRSHADEPRKGLAGLVAECARCLQAEPDGLAAALVEAVGQELGAACLRKLELRFGQLEPDVPYEALRSWALAYGYETGLLAIALAGRRAGLLISAVR